MIDVRSEDNRVIIDVRENIRRGEHPRGEILKVARELSTGTILEIHVPHYTAPLVGALETIGFNVIVNELEQGHFRLMTVKL